MTRMRAITRHLPAVIGVLLVIGALYVVQREFAALRLDDVLAAMDAIPGISIWLAFGVTYDPNVAALALAPHGRDAGAASTIMGALQSAAGVLGGLTVGAFNDGTVVRLVQIMAAGAFLGLLSYLSVRPSIVLQNRNLRS